jgi:hypothetical protein
MIRAYLHGIVITLCLPAVVFTQSSTGPVSARAKQVHDAAIVVDSHADPIQRLVFDKTFDIGARKKGYIEKDVTKILGGNMLRVMEAVEREAAKGKKAALAQPPAFAVISIKPARAGDTRTMRMRVLPNGDFIGSSVPVPLLVRYDLHRAAPTRPRTETGNSDGACIYSRPYRAPVNRVRMRHAEARSQRSINANRTHGCRQTKTANERLFSAAIARRSLSHCCSTMRQVGRLQAGQPWM